MDDFPIVTLEAALGRVVVTQLAEHAEQVSKEVSAVVAEVVENFDFGVEVRRVAQPILARAFANAIGSYFLGDGRRIIDAAVESVLANMAE